MSPFRAYTAAELMRSQVRYFDPSMLANGWDFDPTFRITVEQVKEGYVSGHIQSIEELEYELEEALKWERR